MKNLLLNSALLLTSVAALAQLTVQPNGATDSYVYVNDEVLFVTRDINLTKNNPGPTVASIYLRNDGQLIQEEATSTNSGNGFLSVYQNTTDHDAFDYTYWCSPVGRSHIPLSSGNDNAGLSRIFEPADETTSVISAYTSSYNGYTNPKLTISSRWIYTHPEPGTEAENNYVRVRHYDKIEPGFGFTMKGVNTGGPGAGPGNHAQLYDFRGRPNSGDIDIPVSRDLMTLSGNPYPSALDMNELFYDQPAGVIASFNYYDEDRTADNHNYNLKPYGYGVWTPGGADPGGTNPGLYTEAEFFIWNSGGTNNGGGPTGVSQTGHRFAPIGQGVMFIGGPSAPVAPGTANVTISNSQRVFVPEGATSVFNKNGTDPTSTGLADTTIPATVDNRLPQTRIYVVFNGERTRDLLLAYSEKATDAYDWGFDGPHNFGTDSDAFFPVSTNSDADIKPYVINAVNYDYGKQIPLTIKLDEQMKFEISVVEEVKKPYENIYIYDSQEYTYKKINNGGITGSRGATYTLPAGNYENRFYVVFRSPNNKKEQEDVVLAKNTILENVSFFQNNPAKELEVSNPEGYTIKSASVYDMSGKLVISESDLGDSNKFSFYTGNLSDGVYLVKLLTTDDVTIDYKAIVHNK